MCRILGRREAIGEGWEEVQVEGRVKRKMLRRRGRGWKMMGRMLSMIGIGEEWEDFIMGEEWIQIKNRSEKIG